MNLLLLEPDEVGGDGTVQLAGARARHLREVLRVRPGDTVRVGLLDGPRGCAEVLKVDEASVRLRAMFDTPAPPRPTVDLMLAMPRPKALKRLWAPLATAGVDRIFIVNAERVPKMYFDSDALDPALIRSRLIEGLAQAGETALPQVEVRRRLKPFVEDELNEFAGDACRLLALSGDAPRVADRVLPSRRVWLAVGPEGGWTPRETAWLCDHGFHCVSMGPRIWRADAAALALLALVHDALRAVTAGPVTSLLQAP